MPIANPWPFIDNILELVRNPLIFKNVLLAADVKLVMAERFDHGINIYGVSASALKMLEPFCIYLLMPHIILLSASFVMCVPSATKLNYKLS